MSVNVLMLEWFFALSANMESLMGLFAANTTTAPQTFS